MRCTVEELGSRISSRELAEWQEYFAIGAEQLVMEDLKRAAVERLGAKTKRRR